jgi:hypothetical protein
MKITRTQLKRLIKEEMSRVGVPSASMEEKTMTSSGGRRVNADDAMTTAIADLDWSGEPDYTEGMPTELDDTPLKTWWQSKRPVGVTKDDWEERRIPAYEDLQQAD